MLESALEFARICRKLDYHDFMFSMKSSNPQVMIAAYRLLTAEMITLGWDYPLHLGVTEAGEGEDGRIKSAMGIGSLLLDGIGDTIRVSLTEDAWNEIDPCKRLVAFAETYHGSGVPPFEEKHRNIETFSRRSVQFSNQFSFHRDGTVIVNAHDLDQPEKLGFDMQFGRPKLKISSPDAIAIPQNTSPMTIQKFKESGISLLSQNGNEATLTVLSLAEVSAHLISTRFAIAAKKHSYAIKVQDELPEHWNILAEAQPVAIILSPTKNRLHYARQFFDWLKAQQIQIPVILSFHHNCSKDDLVIQAAAEYGALLCDGLGEGLWINAPYETDFLRSLSFNILQAARMRTFKTDFISCPSCGRTLFDLQDVSKRIRERTSHLPGVKIAIMGCIVNGPGEMADADFGYVGSKPGMIDLYIGKTCVEKDILFSDADDRLIELIKKNGRWIDPAL
jgi:(E)-4-hydroxy-3-methylbut-2-enyl-diphosphate synthase